MAERPSLAAGFVFPQSAVQHHLLTPNKQIMETKAYNFLTAEILKTERRVFAGRILATLFGYVLFSTWLSYVRETAPLWFVWTLIIAQWLLYFLIFIVSHRRAQAIGLKTFGIIPFIILAALGRINDWELVIIPGLIITMLIISARTKTMSAQGQAILQPQPSHNPDKPDAQTSRRLITLVSTKGKTSKEVARELNDNVRKDKERHRAKIIEYADYSKDMPLDCPECGWHGTPRSSEFIEYHDDVLDVSCPNCKKMLLVVGYPLSPDFPRK